MRSRHLRMGVVRLGFRRSLRIDTFLSAEGLLPNEVPLTKSSFTGEWLLSDTDMLLRWRQSHGTGGLRWVSLHGNREENRRSQRMA